jgi:hypothetical protein
MIRPEGHEALDKGPFGNDALGERGMALGRRDADEGAPRALTSLSSFLIVALASHAKTVDGLGNGARRPFSRSNKEGHVSMELPAKPTFRVGDTPAFAGARAESEAVEGAKRGIHDIDLNAIRRQTAGPYTRS